VRVLYSWCVNKSVNKGYYSNDGSNRVVSRGQTAFFLLHWVGKKKQSGHARLVIGVVGRGGGWA